MAVRMYTTRWCGDCFKAKRFLKERAIEFEEVDIELDSGAADRLVEWTGGKRVVPTLEVNGHVLINPEIRDLASALEVEY